MLTAGMGTISKSNEVRPPLNPKSSKGSRKIPGADLPQVGFAARMLIHLITKTTELTCRDISSSPSQSRKRGSSVIPRSLTLSSPPRRWRRFVYFITGTSDTLTNSWTVWTNTSSPTGMWSIAHSSLRLAVIIAYMYTTKLNLSWQKVVRRLRIVT
jgi:hypothetical protein